MITTDFKGECEGVLLTGIERESEASKIATHVASVIMYCMMFELLIEPDDIAQFIRYRFPTEHVKVVMLHSSYDLQSDKVILHQTSNFDIDNDMRDMAGEDWIDMSILENTATLDIGPMDSGVIFDYDNNNGSLG